MAGEIKYDPELHPVQIVEMMKQGKTISQVCMAFGISRPTYYTWREKHEKFREASEFADTCRQAYWEEILAKGCEGKIPYFNSNAIAFNMRAQFQDYREKEPQNTTNNFMLSVSDEQLDRLLLEKLKKGKLIESIKDVDGEVVNEPSRTE